MSETVLVTGITGFIAKQVAADLLKAGHRVRGTLRSPARADEVRRAMAARRSPSPTGPTPTGPRSAPTRSRRLGPSGPRGSACARPAGSATSSS